MTDTLSLPTASGIARPSAPSLVTLAGTELRKSVSTRSGRAVGIGALLIGPLGTLVGGLGGEATWPGGAILGVTGTLTSLVLLAVGVLSTAGEWTNRSVQTTFLLVPQRGRVVAAKVLAMTVLGAVLAAVGAALTIGMLWAIPDPVEWTHIGPSLVVVTASGAAFTVIGAGIGAAAGNPAAALTGTYLTVLGLMPILNHVKPAWGDRLDPVSAILEMTQSDVLTRPVLVIAGWVVAATVLGAVMTRRRPVG